MLKFRDGINMEKEFNETKDIIDKSLINEYKNWENSSHQKDIFIKDENNLFNKKITEDTKKKIIENNISLEKQIMKEKTKEEEKAKKKLLGSVEKQKKIGNKKEGVMWGIDNRLTVCDRDKKTKANYKKNEI